MCWDYKPIKMTAIWTGSTGFVCSIRPSDFEYPPKKWAPGPMNPPFGGFWMVPRGTLDENNSKWRAKGIDMDRYTMIYHDSIHMVYTKHMIYPYDIHILSIYIYIHQAANIFRYFSAEYTRDCRGTYTFWGESVGSFVIAGWDDHSVDFEISNSFFAFEIDRISFPQTKSIKRGDACQLRANASFRNAGMWVWVSPLRDHKKNYSSLSLSCSQSQHHV